jgi:hypothetical protein
MKNNIVLGFDLCIVIVKICTGYTYRFGSFLKKLVFLFLSLVLVNKDSALFITVYIILFVKLFVISPFFLKKRFFKSLCVVTIKFRL